MAAQKMTKTAVDTETEVEVKTKKKFEKDDLIPCKSITSGELLMSGAKTNEIYSWADYGYVTDIEYQDLLYDVRSARGGSSFSTMPRFIILDEDFVEQNIDKLGGIYDNLYTISDLREILDLPVGKIKAVVDELPSGAKNSLKNIVGTMINDGSFDSVNKIKVFDEIFGTQMLQLLVN